MAMSSPVRCRLVALRSGRRPLRPRSRARSWPCHRQFAVGWSHCGRGAGRCGHGRGRGHGHVIASSLSVGRTAVGAPAAAATVAGAVMAMSSPVRCRLVALRSGRRPLRPRSRARSWPCHRQFAVGWSHCGRGAGRCGHGRGRGHGHVIASSLSVGRTAVGAPAAAATVAGAVMAMSSPVRCRLVALRSGRRPLRPRSRAQPSARSRSCRRRFAVRWPYGGPGLQATAATVMLEPTPTPRRSTPPRPSGAYTRTRRWTPPVTRRSS